jgi:hypothetical protein
MGSANSSAVGLKQGASGIWAASCASRAARASAALCWYCGGSRGGGEGVSSVVGWVGGWRNAGARLARSVRASRRRASAGSSSSRAAAQTSRPRPLAVSVTAYATRRADPLVAERPESTRFGRGRATTTCRSSRPSCSCFVSATKNSRPGPRLGVAAAAPGRAARGHPCCPAAAGRRPS